MTGLRRREEDGQKLNITIGIVLQMHLNGVNRFPLGKLTLIRRASRCFGVLVFYTEATFHHL